MYFANIGFFGQVFSFSASNFVLWVDCGENKRKICKVGFADFSHDGKVRHEGW